MHTHMDEIWHTVTHTHKRLKSSSQLTSPTRTCLDFFLSLPYRSNDVFATSGGTRYIHARWDTSKRKERSAREGKGVTAAREGRTTEGQPREEWDKVMEGAGNQGQVDGKIPWVMYHEDLKLHSKKLGYPLVGTKWQSGPFGIVGVPSCGAVNPSGSEVSLLELQWHHDKRTLLEPPETQADPFCWAKAPGPSFPTHSHPVSDRQSGSKGETRGVNMKASPPSPHPFNPISRFLFHFSFRG